MKKKYLWIIVAVVVLAVIGVVVALSQKTDEEKLIDELEQIGQTDQTTEFGGIPISYQVASSVSEEAKKVVSISYRVDKGLLDLGKLTAGITITNNSPTQIVEKAVISLVVFGKDGSVLAKSTKTISKDVGRGAIQPSETREYEYFFDQLNLKLLKDINRFAVVLEQVGFKGATNTTPPSTTQTSVTPTVVAGSPEQVVKSFYQAWAEGKYEDLKKYLSSADLQRLTSTANGYQQWVDSLKQKEVPTLISVAGAESISDSRVQVKTVVLYKDGKQVDMFWPLVKEGTEWKITLM